MIGETVYGIFASIKDGEKVYSIHEGKIMKETKEKIKADFGFLTHTYDRSAEGTTFFYNREAAEERKEHCESFAAVRIKEFFEQK